MGLYTGPMTNDTLHNTRYLLTRVGDTKWGVRDQDTGKLVSFRAGGRVRLYTCHVAYACDGANALNGRKVYA
jgi:hypothetical protein